MTTALPRSSLSIIHHRLKTTSHIIEITPTTAPTPIIPPSTLPADPVAVALAAELDPDVVRIAEVETGASSPMALAPIDEEVWEEVVCELVWEEECEEDECVELEERDLVVLLDEAADLVEAFVVLSEVVVALVVVAAVVLVRLVEASVEAKVLVRFVPTAAPATVTMSV